MQKADFYKNLPPLETKRLILRKFTLEDANDYFEFASDPEVTKFLRWGPHPNKEYTQQYLQRVLNDYSQGEDGPWGIELKAIKKLIGSIHIMQLNTHHRKAEIGFVLAQTCWNNGYMTEALERVLEYSFTELSLNRIEALCIPENHAAIRVLEKTGMKLEGNLRQYEFLKGNFVDVRLFSILNAEYLRRRG
jgi:ribosomal-protein-alanine N-acetyltransferase